MDVSGFVSSLKGVADDGRMDFGGSEERYNRFIDTVCNYDYVVEYFPAVSSLKCAKEIEEILDKRKEAMKNNDFVELERLKYILWKKGFNVLDIENNQILEKI